MPRFLIIAYRNVVRHRRRSVFSILIVAFGVTAMTLATGFIEWNVDYGREAMIRSQFGHIQVARPGYLNDGLADPFAYLLSGLDKEFRSIEQQPHVRKLAPRLAFNGLISFGDSMIPFIGMGVEPDRETSLSESVTITAGSGLAAEDRRGIIVGQGLAANLGVAVGDTVVLMSNTPTGGMNAVEVKVRGLFSTIFKAYDDTALRLPLPVARQLLRVQGEHNWVALLDDTANTAMVLRDLKEKYSGQALEFVPWTALADFYNKTAALFAKQANVIKVIISSIVVLSISNTLMMGVFERTSEIGTSLAIGMKRDGMLRLFLAEGLLLGLFGSSAGLLAGYLLAQLITLIGIPMPPGPGMDHGYIAGITITAPLAIEAFVISFCATLCASAYPAWRASRIAIVDALRHNR